MTIITTLYNRYALYRLYGKKWISVISNIIYLTNISKTRLNIKAVERIHRYYKNYIHTEKMNDKRPNWNHNFLKQNQINQLQQQV